MNAQTSTPTPLPDDRHNESHIQDSGSLYEIDPTLHKDLETALLHQDADTAHAIIVDLHAADKAELLNYLNEDQRHELIDMLSDNFDSDILPELSPEVVEDVLESLGRDKTIEALSQLEMDDAVHVIEELDEEDQQELLAAAPELFRGELEEGLAYPEDSAGRLMTKKLVCVPTFWTVGDAIDMMRAKESDLPNNFYVIYAVDPKFKPVGRIQLAKLMRYKRAEPVTSLMQHDVYAVQTDTDQEEVAFLFRKYALVEAPVVNAQGRLVGTITVDDVVHVMQEEEEEDYLRAGGVTTQDIQASLSETVRQRFPWLFINLLTAVLASIVIGLYSRTIEQMVALAVLMPIVASMGGNAGTQSVTVAVRALATRQLKSSNSMAAIRKELLIGLLNGVGLGAIMGLGAYLWYGDLWLAIVFAIATVTTLMVAGFSGAFIPIVLNKMKADPAISSSVFLTTVTDVIGFLTFLGLATLLLM